MTAVSPSEGGGGALVDSGGCGELRSVSVNGASLGNGRREPLLRSFVQPGKDAAMLGRTLVVASPAQIHELLFQQTQLLDAF